MVTKVTTTSTKIQCAINDDDNITIEKYGRTSSVKISLKAICVKYIVIDKNRAQIFIDTLKEHFDL